ncbi:MAG: heparinase II/III family protein [Rhodoferax sp.]
MSKKSRRGLVRVSYFAAVSLALVLLWLPEISHYYVPIRSLPDSLNMRTFTEPVHLEEALDTKLITLLRFKTDDQWLAAADNLLVGQLIVPGFNPLSIDLQFDPVDLTKGLPTVQLVYASLAAPDILLRAYEISGNPKYFTAAKQFMVSFCIYERRQWLEQGFLWNDHAIANRAEVLIRLWKNYLAQQVIDKRFESLFFIAIMRHADFLAKSDLFTVATNHGVIQNLALLQLAGAFPLMPDVDRYRAVAFDRLKTQIPFYINVEGVVLEHSAGYHADGAALLSSALALSKINHLSPPADWYMREQNAQRFLTNLARPDGSLPVFGNTEWQPYSDLAGRQPIDARSLYPGAGYAVWWDGLAASPKPAHLAQTVVAWSLYPGHGHNLADEMSLMIWAHGVSWLGNTGYWPYGVAGQSEATGWGGSNAPHAPNEPEKSARHVTLNGFVNSKKMDWLDLERHNDDGFNVRRQLIKLSDLVWLVLDSSNSQLSKDLTRTWTFHPNLTLQVVHPGKNYRLISTTDDQRAMSVFFSGSSPPVVQSVREQMLPFAGWTVFDRKPRPAPALVVNQKGAGQWTMSTFALETALVRSLSSMPVMTEWHDPEHFAISMNVDGSSIKVARQGQQLAFSSNGSDNISEIVAVPNQQALREPVDRAFAQAVRQYPHFKEVFAYRLRYTEWLAGLALILEGFFGLIRLRFRVLESRLRIALGLAWIATGSWLSFYYLTI